MHFPVAPTAPLPRPARNSQPDRPWHHHAARHTKAAVAAGSKKKAGGGCMGAVVGVGRPEKLTYYRLPYYRPESRSILHRRGVLRSLTSLCCPFPVCLRRITIPRATVRAIFFDMFCCPLIVACSLVLSPSHFTLCSPFGLSHCRPLPTI